jgi:hypothetical protein
LAEDITRNHRSRFLKHFSQDSRIHCSPDGDVQTADQFWEELQRQATHWTDASKMLSAGRSILGRVRWQNLEASQDTVIQLSFARHSLKVVALRCFFPILPPIE